MTEGLTAAGSERAVTEGLTAAGIERAVTEGLTAAGIERLHATAELPQVHRDLRAAAYGALA